ncbi:MAG: hypothetical protein INR65_08230 [Gluconacetobacter diazotrophicus]|nr:hypothetical protein [Gluconacetobacter diazotrophicus]
MSDQLASGGDSPVPRPARRLDVSFGFANGWTVRTPDRTISFPPGGGLGDEEIRLDPLRLDGLDEAAVLAAIARRAGDLALVSEALALVTLQFQDAVASCRAASAAP